MSLYKYLIVASLTFWAASSAAQSPLASGPDDVVVWTPIDTDNSAIGTLYDGLFRRIEGRRLRLGVRQRRQATTSIETHREQSALSLTAQAQFRGAGGGVRGGRTTESGFVRAYEVRRRAEARRAPSESPPGAAYYVSAVFYGHGLTATLEGSSREIEASASAFKAEGSLEGSERSTLQNVVARGMTWSEGQVPTGTWTEQIQEHRTSRMEPLLVRLTPLHDEQPIFDHLDWWMTDDFVVNGQIATQAQWDGRSLRRPAPDAHPRESQIRYYLRIGRVVFHDDREWDVGRLNGPEIVVELRHPDLPRSRMDRTVRGDQNSREYNDDSDDRLQGPMRIMRDRPLVIKVVEDDPTDEEHAGLVRVIYLRPGRNEIRTRFDVSVFLDVVQEPVGSE